MNVRQNGFSLIETLLVLVIIAFISAIAISRFFVNGKDVGSIERFVSSASERISERRDDARRLNGESSRRDLTIGDAPPVVIDFAELETTSSLLTEGVDANGDCIDDFSLTSFTCLTLDNKWNYIYTGDSLKFPKSWELVKSQKILNTLSIPIFAEKRGIMVSKIGFDSRGRAYGFEKSGWQKQPGGQVSKLDETPTLFSNATWAMYFNDGSEKTAIAIAISPNGTIETFRYDGENWIGFGGRLENR